MSVGQRVKNLRKSLNLTQKEFAAKIPARGEGIYDWTYIGKIERDDQYPSIKYLKKIGDAFSVPLSYFFEDGRPRTFQKRESIGRNVRAIVCLIGRYKWDLGHFRQCGSKDGDDICEFQPLCDIVKGLAMVDDEPHR